MLTAVSNAIRTPELRAAALPAPAQEPTLPQDRFEDLPGIAFERIDTPQKAAQVPIMDPAFQLALALGVTNCLHQPGINVYLNADTNSNGVEFHQGTNFHPQEDGGLATGGGLIGQLYFQSNYLRREGEEFSYSERFASNDSQLRLSADEGTMHLLGNIGDVGVELAMKLSSVTDEQGQLVTTLDSRGTLGGQPYELTTEVREGKATARGNLNGEAIVKDYRVEQSSEGPAQMLLVQGTGTNAGYDQSVQLNLTWEPGQG